MLTEVLEGHSIVLAGAWNIRIFSPEWVAQNVAETQEVMLAVSVGNPNAPIRLQFRDIYLRVGQERVILSPVVMNAEVLTTMQNCAQRILDRLQHTPMVAVGINFQFLEDEPPNLLRECFSTPDRDALTHFGAAINSTSLVRSLVVNDRPVNVRFEQRPNGIVMDFNFHSDTPTAQVARQRLAVGLETLRTSARNLLTHVYGVQ